MRTSWRKQDSIRSYKTAWLMLNKLRRAMTVRDMTKLHGVVEVDETYIRFRSKDDPDVPIQGRSTVGKMPMAVAVEVREFIKKDGNSGTRPGRIRLEPVPDTTKHTMHGFIRRNIEPGSALVTDGSSTRSDKIA